MQLPYDKFKGIVETGYKYLEITGEAFKHQEIEDKTKVEYIKRVKAKLEHNKSQKHLGNVNEQGTL